VPASVSWQCRGRVIDVLVFYVVWFAVVIAAAWLAKRAWARRRRPLGLLTRCPHCGGNIRTDVRLCAHCFRRVPPRAAARPGELQTSRPDE
jgi:predicted amidophosphoribosyltransferase